MIKIRLLGQFDLRLNGKPVEIPSRPAQSLLAYLALTAGITHRRERLAGLIWPDIPELDARRNLRRALWHIRKAAEGQAPLRADDITVAFDARPDVWVDVLVVSQKFNAEKTVEELIQIVSAYGGELLPGFYDEWVIVERERLQAVFEGRIKLLLDRLVEAHSWDEVIEWGEKWIALSGATEPAYRALMIAYSGRGDLSGVGLAYRRCSETLSRDLGVEPSEETHNLFVQLSRQRQIRAVAAKSPPSQDQSIEKEYSKQFEFDSQANGLVVSSESIPLDEGSLEPPYKGLQFFDEVDAGLFFGREELIAQLLVSLGFSQDGLTNGNHLLFIVGASGSGKSSLARAGLVPAIRKSMATPGQPGLDRKLDWAISVITPTSHPLEALATSLTSEVESVTAAATLMDDMARDPRSLRLYIHKEHIPLFLVIDQMEELFTSCREESERRAFLDNLLNAAEGGQCKIVLTLRADFYAHCARYENLRTVLANRQVYIGPMSATELRRVIEEPAKDKGYTFEAGLVDLILRETGHEPGSLPLLSHALLETWKRRQFRTLTLAGYAETGGVQGAISHTAESLYTRLTPQQQKIARNIFLRLTELGEGVQDTRRRATLEELVLHTEDYASVEEVLNLLAKARLVTLSEDSVEIAHEALIREWPTLRAWLSEDRESLRLHRHLTESTLSWEELDREPGELYRGARLAQAIEWYAGHPGVLNKLEADFLAASQAQSEQEIIERERARQREIETAQRFAESEKRRAGEQAQTAQRFRWLAAVLAILLLAAVVIAGYALQQRQQARIAAILSRSRELAAAAVSSLNVDPERSVLLALQAVKLTDTYEAVDALHLATQASRVRRTLQVSEQPVIGVNFSKDGKRLATSSADGFVRIWDLSSGQVALTLMGHSRDINMVVFNPDGSRLATASDDSTAKVWDAQTGKASFTLSGHKGFVTGVKFSPDGKFLITVGADNTIRVWDANSGKERSVFSGHSQAIRDLAFSPDGSRLVTASDDHTARIWEVSTGRVMLTLSGHNSELRGVAYSPDGKYIATASSDRTAKLWDASTGEELQSFTGHTNVVQGVTFSPSGDRLATGSYDGRVKIWSIPDGNELISLSGRAVQIYRVAFSPDGLQVASANSDGTTQLWDVTPKKEYLTLTGHQGMVNSVMYSPDGKQLVTASMDNTAAIWDARTGKVLAWLRGHDGPIIQAVFSPDGSQLATASDDLTARVWDTFTGQELFRYSGHSKGSAESPFSGLLDITFSPDGTLLATAGSDSRILIWEVASQKQLMQFSGHADRVNSIAYSPDGALLASGSDDNTIKIWDTASGKEILTLEGHTLRVWSVVFSQDGTRLASGSTDSTVILWDVRTGKQLMTLSGHTSTVLTVVFSNQMDRLASASTDGTAKVWDAQSGKELLTLSDKIAFSGVSFSPDGSLLAASRHDNSVQVYFLQVADLVNYAQSRLTRWFTQEECIKYLHSDPCPVLK